MVQEPIRIAVLGAGAIAATHLDAYLSFPELCQVSAVCDLFVEKAEQMVKERGLNARVFRTLEEALAGAEFDAVSICLPPDAHCETAVAALNAGKHVLCEKPMAASLEECDKMIEAARERGKLLSVVCQNRFKTPMQKVKQLIDAQAAGPVRFATIDSLWWRGANYYDIWWRGTWEKESGGCTTSHAVHHLDLLQWMLGMPKRVTAVIANVAHDNSECEDLGLAILEYGDKIAQVTASLVSHGEEQSMTFQCEKARLSIPWAPAANKALPNGFPQEDAEALEAIQQAYQSLQELPLENHPAQLKNFLRAIRGEEPLAIDGEEGRKTIELIMAIYRSAAMGQPVQLPLRKGDPFYRKASMNAIMPRFHQKTRSVDNFSTSKITFSRDVGK